MSGAQILLFIVSNIYLLLLNGTPKQILCLCVMAANPLIAIGLSLFVKEDLRRLSSVLLVSMISNQSRSKSRTGTFQNITPISKTPTTASEAKIQRTVSDRIIPRTASSNKIQMPQSVNSMNELSIPKLPQSSGD